MILFPNAKINLGLNVTERRPDGYHNLETIFYPIHIEDILEVVPLSETKNNSASEDKVLLHLLGNSLEGTLQDNLVVKAYNLLDSISSLPPIEIFLQKRIPSGAGLGGGSADAAFMLRLLNDLFKLELTIQELQQLAAKLGADCAFFIENKPCYATGIGNIFHPIELDLSTYYILVVKPQIFVSTRDAFKLIQPTRPTNCVYDICKQPIEEWHRLLKNDFENSVFPQFPELGQIKEQLYKSGAIYASMSGSGSSLYGIYKEKPIQAAKLFHDIFTWWGAMK